MVWLSKILEMTYNLQLREYLLELMISWCFREIKPSFWILDVPSYTFSLKYKHHCFFLKKYNHHVHKMSLERTFMTLENILMWQNHPKRLGPGALIFVAKQLWPKLALTGSSSSEASIKATLFQDQQTTLTRRWAQRLQHRTFHTSQSDCSGKEIYYKPGSE